MQGVEGRQIQESGIVKREKKGERERENEHAGIRNYGKGEEVDKSRNQGLLRGRRK